MRIFLDTSRQVFLFSFQRYKTFTLVLVESERGRTSLKFYVPETKNTYKNNFKGQWCENRAFNRALVFSCDDIPIVF